jgi:hypothetical protein
LLGADVRNWVDNRQAALRDNLAKTGRFDYILRMHPSNFIEADRPTGPEVEAAARELHDWGALHGWWLKSLSSFDALDPIGREEFEAIVERVLMAAAAAKRGIAPATP